MTAPTLTDRRPSTPGSHREQPGTCFATRDRNALLAQLTIIDGRGWDSAAGEALLTYVRRTIVHPQIITTGLVGAVADHAEATAWEMTWRVLSGDTIRDADSPWGILWAAAKRAIADESVAAVYRTSPRVAWARRAAHRNQARAHGDRHVVQAMPPLSLDALADVGHEVPDIPVVAHDLAPRSALLDAVVGQLESAGWPPAEVTAILGCVADRAQHHRGHPRLLGGWRALAVDVSIPGWQARRLTHVLLGTCGWTGLIERLATPTLNHTMTDVDVAAAIASTRDARLPSPEQLAGAQSLRRAS